MHCNGLRLARSLPLQFAHYTIVWTCKQDRRGFSFLAAPVLQSNGATTVRSGNGTMICSVFFPTSCSGWGGGGGGAKHIKSTTRCGTKQAWEIFGAYLEWREKECPELVQYNNAAPGCMPGA